MKKILGLVALFVIIVLSCFYFFIHQPKNIFDEIY
ncbi:TipC family immunity protein, partial [Streptococcus sp. HMSC072D07]